MTITSVENLVGSARNEQPDESFRLFLDTLPLPVYITDSNGIVIFRNSAAGAVTAPWIEIGADLESVAPHVSRSDGAPFSDEQWPVKIALQGGQQLHAIEYLAEQPDGARFGFVPSCTALRDSTGQVTGAICVLVGKTSRKSAELDASPHFRAIFDTTPECVKMVARDGCLLHMNASGLAMIGAPSADAVLGKSVYNLIAPEDLDRFRLFNEAVCSGERGALEFDIIDLGGKRRHMETHAAPLRSVDGSVVQLAVTRDVTERRQAERAALLLSAIVDSSDDAIVSKDLNGFITSWNRGAQRLFGYTAEEAVGRPITILIPHERWGEEWDILSRLKRGERVDHFETVRRRKDGAFLHISLTISPVKDQHGAIIGASKIARDITDRKLAEAALIASENRFRQLADSMPQIVWTARSDGFIDYYNERWYEFTGYSRESLGNESWAPLLHPHDVEDVTASWYECVRSGNPFSRELRFWDRHESRWRWFIGRALPVRDSSGNVAKWFGSSTDIDEQKRAQDELRHANRDLQQFGYSASHDLQEPLRTLKIYSELLWDRYGDKLEGDAAQFLGFIHQGAGRMEALVRDLLAYTEVSSYEIPVAPVDANQVLELTLAGLSGVVDQTQATITSNDLPALRVHPAHLQQLFQNLLQNAIQYRSAGRTPVIAVAAAREDDCWHFRISDNGIGIHPAYKEKIFGLFKRLHSEDEYSGTGIGLAICQRIVGRYQGRIWIESEPGAGAVFHFTLPA